MLKTGLNFRVLCRYSLLFLAGLLCVTFLSSLTEAEQQSATISSLNNEVLVSFQGETPTFGIAGTVLRAGDAIQTYSGANAILSLSDGSKLDLGENTNINI